MRKAIGLALTLIGVMMADGNPLWVPVIVIAMGATLLGGKQNVER